MLTLKIINKSSNRTIAEKAILADSFISRLVGLLNRRSLPEGEALIITRCKSIHMFFMRFAIDAIFVDKNNYVVGLVSNIKPFQLSPVFLSSSYVIEAPVGTIIKAKVSIGDNIELQQ